MSLSIPKNQNHVASRRTAEERLPASYKPELNSYAERRRAIALQIRYHEDRIRELGDELLNLTRTFKQPQTREQWLGEHIAEVIPDVRTVNSLEMINVFTVKDLLNCSEARLREAPMLGDEAVRMIFVSLARIGFVRGRNPERPDHSLACEEN